MQDIMREPLPTQQISDSGDANPGTHLCKLSEQFGGNEFAPLLSVLPSSCWVHPVVWVHIRNPYEVEQPHKNLLFVCKDELYTLNSLNLLML